MSHTGVPVFDPYFDASPKENQLQLRDLCNHLETSQYAYVRPDMGCPILDIEREALE